MRKSMIEAYWQNFNSIDSLTFRNIEDFIRYTKENKDKFRHYCSVTIDGKGCIYINRYGHPNMLHMLTGIGMDEIPDYATLDYYSYLLCHGSYISVDYETQVSSPVCLLTEECKNAFRRLGEEKLIFPNLSYVSDKDYQKFKEESNNVKKN